MPSSSQETVLPEIMNDREVVHPTLAMARRSLQILEEQAAGFGKLQIPAHLKLQLDEKRQDVASLQARLKQLQDSDVVSIAEIKPNPFGDTGCITDASRFFGREELLRRIFEELDRAC